MPALERPLQGGPSLCEVEECCRARIWSLRGFAPTRAERACATIEDVGRTVLIVDDHATFRSLARALLEAAGFDVVGEAADGASALSEVRRLRPAIVLLDVHLPDLDGFSVTRRLAAAGGGPAVVLVSSRDASSYRRRLADSPACGFIAKADLSADALAALVA
jgi:DNA-binding NarL/FixJ family response regulator